MPFTNDHHDRHPFASQTSVILYLYNNLPRQAIKSACFFARKTAFRNRFKLAHDSLVAFKDISIDPTTDPIKKDQWNYCGGADPFVYHPNTTTTSKACRWLFTPEFPSSAITFRRRQHPFPSCPITDPIFRRFFKRIYLANRWDRKSLYRNATQRRQRCTWFDILQVHGDGPKNVVPISRRPLPPCRKIVANRKKKVGEREWVSEWVASRPSTRTLDPISAHMSAQVSTIFQLTTLSGKIGKNESN